MKKNEEFNIDNQYFIIKKLIENGKLIFSYYNSKDELELLNVIQNNKDGIIEIKFRDVYNERIQEIKELLERKHL